MRKHKLFFTTPAAAGYGARIYLSREATGESERAHETLTFVSRWQGSDKTFKDSLGTTFLGYEMAQKMADAMTDLLERKGFQQEVPFQE